MPRGQLIVFEGLDRAGKSTQCTKLVADLQKDGLRVRHLRFPGMYRESACMCVCVCMCVSVDRMCCAVESVVEVVSSWMQGIARKGGTRRVLFR